MANKPNNPSLWSKAKSLAKQKFDVYPSAYANGWAAKWYKGHGGTWRKAKYGAEVDGDDLPTYQGSTNGSTVTSAPPNYPDMRPDVFNPMPRFRPLPLGANFALNNNNLYKLSYNVNASGVNNDNKFRVIDPRHNFNLQLLSDLIGKGRNLTLNGDSSKRGLNLNLTGSTPMLGGMLNITGGYNKRNNQNDQVLDEASANFMRVKEKPSYNASVSWNGTPFGKSGPTTTIGFNVGNGRSNDMPPGGFAEGGEPQNEGFQALPEYVQEKIMDNMAQGGEKMPPEIARARFAAAGNLDRLDDYGYAYGGYTPEMAAGGWAQQAAIAIAMKKAGKKPKSMKDGGDPDGGMALGQIDATIEKLQKLRQFIQPDSDLEPWVNSKLTLMDDYSAAVSDYMTHNPEAHEEMEEPQGLPMEEMKNGGIPQRYKNMGFTHVGQKKQGDGKHKWKVLAKKGDQYKVVQGGWRGMQDFSQHHSEKRKERFWDRMGGRNSSKATDPFSPLYWHKRFGTWEEGGEKKESNFSGNAWYSDGGNILNNKNMFTYPFLPMAQTGYEVDQPRQEDYPDYNSFAAAMDNWLAGLGAGMQRPIESDTPGGIPRPLPIELQQQLAASVQAAPAQAVQVKAAPKIDYKGVSIVDLLNSVGAPSDYNSRKSLAVELGITNYIGSAEQNSKLIKMVMNNPTVLDEYKKAVVNSKPKVQRRASSATAAESNKTQAAAPAQIASPRTNQSRRAELANQRDFEEAAAFATNPMNAYSKDPRNLVYKDFKTGRYVPNFVGQGLMDPQNAERIKLAEQMNMADAIRNSGQPYFSQSRNYEMGGTPCYECGGMFAYGGYLPEQYAEGGINIKPANKGKFTAKAKAAGMGVQEYASKVLNAPEGDYPASTRKQANFARNASKWKKAEGGPVKGDVLDVTPEQLQMLKAGGYTFEILD